MYFSQTESSKCSLESLSNQPGQPRKSRNTQPRRDLEIKIEQALSRRQPHLALWHSNSGSPLGEGWSRIAALSWSASLSVQPAPRRRDRVPTRQGRVACSSLLASQVSWRRGWDAASRQQRAPSAPSARRALARSSSRAGKPPRRRCCREPDLEASPSFICAGLTSTTSAARPPYAGGIWRLAVVSCGKALLMARLYIEYMHRTHVRAVTRRCNRDRW